MNIDPVTTTFDLAAKKFSKNLGISLISKVPLIGDVLSAGISSWIEARDEQKMTEVLKLIGEQINQLSEEKVDQVYLDSPEFAELISQVLKHSRDNTAEEKASFYAQVAVESSLVDRIQIESVWRNEIMEKISEVNIEEFLFLKSIAGATSINRAISIKSRTFDQFKEKKLCISSLITKGLIEDASINNVADPFNPGQQRALKTEGLIRLTEMGRRVTDYILSVQNNLNKHIQSSE